MHDQGGSQNQLLCQFTADACGRPVYAGPVEATALGSCASWAEAREIVRAAFPLEAYEPRNVAAWDDAYVRFQQVLAKR